MWCCKKDLRSRSLLSSRFLFFHCRYAASDASLREDSEEESVPSPSVVVVVCDDTSDELDDSEFRDVFRTNEDSAEGLMMSGVRWEGSGGGKPGGRERPAGRNGGEAAELEADDELSTEDCFKSGRE